MQRRLAQAGVITAAVLASVVASHAAISLMAHDGPVSSTLAIQESEHGRDWAGVALTIAGVAIAFGLVAVAQVHRLRRQASMVRQGRLTVEDRSLSVLGGVMGRIWLPILAATSTGLLLHENIETASAGLPLPGVSVLGGDHAMALPVVAVVSLVVALVAALVRLGRHVLLLRRTRTPSRVRRDRSAHLVRPRSRSRPRSLVAVLSHGLRAPPAMTRGFV